MKYELYELLGVEAGASQGDITKAFRLRALAVHPDKNPDDAENATEKFQLLQKAFDVLRDPKKRKYYDDTGDIVDTSDEFEDLYSRFRSRFAEVTPLDIEQFSEKYKGSDEERQDILNYLRQYKGDMSNFFFCVPLAEAAEAERFSQVISNLVKDKQFNETKAFCKTFPEFNDIAKAWERKSKSEAKKAAKSSSGSKGAKTGGADDVADIKSLALAIKANQARRSNQSSAMWSSFMDKYADPSSSAGSRKVAGGKVHTGGAASSSAHDREPGGPHQHTMGEDVPADKALLRPVRAKRDKGAPKARAAKKTKK